MNCWYKLKCGNKVRRMIQVAQPCQEGSKRDKCVEDGMLQCLSDKAGMWGPVVEAGRAHATALFEINEKWDTWLVLIKGKCFDHCIRGESKKSKNGVFDLSSGFLLHCWPVYTYVVSTMPCEHGGLCHQPEPVVIPYGIEWAVESCDTATDVSISYCNRNYSSFSILWNLTHSFSYIPSFSKAQLLLWPLLLLRFGSTLQSGLPGSCDNTWIECAGIGMFWNEWYQWKMELLPWKAVSRAKHQRWQSSMGQQLLSGEVKGMWRAGKKEGPMVKYCA